MGASVNKGEPMSEDRAKTVCIVPRDREAAAFFGAIRRECADDGVSAASEGASEPVNIGDLVSGVGQEVERRAVVPNIIDLRRLPCRHIGDYPFDAICPVSDACFGGCERRC